MTWVLEARVTSGPALVFQSSGLEVLEGDLSTVPAAVLEKLVTPGVDYQRHREIFRAFGDLRVLLTEDVTDTAGMYERESDYSQAVGEICKLSILIRGAMVRWMNTTIESVAVARRDGPLNGLGAKAGSRHTIRSIWNFRRNQEGEVSA